MSSCQGELSQQEFHVRAIDRNNGEILYDEMVSTLRNGFFELWLPRDRVIDMTIKGLSRKARGTIETSDDSKTCVTTFRLR
jgi:hypothetical protein